MVLLGPPVPSTELRSPSLPTWALRAIQGSTSRVGHVPRAALHNPVLPAEGVARSLEKPLHGDT